MFRVRAYAYDMDIDSMCRIFTKETKNKTEAKKLYNNLCKSPSPGVVWIEKVFSQTLGGIICKKLNGVGYCNECGDYTLIENERNRCLNKRCGCIR